MPSPNRQPGLEGARQSRDQRRFDDTGHAGLETVPGEVRPNPECQAHFDRIRAGRVHANSFGRAEQQFFEQAFARSPMGTVFSLTTLAPGRARRGCRLRSSYDESSRETSGRLHVQHRRRVTQRRRPHHSAANSCRRYCSNATCTRRRETAQFAHLLQMPRQQFVLPTEPLFHRQRRRYAKSRAQRRATTRTGITSAASSIARS